MMCMSRLQKCLAWFLATWLAAIAAQAQPGPVPLGPDQDHKSDACNVCPEEEAQRLGLGEVYSAVQSVKSPRSVSILSKVLVPECLQGQSCNYPVDITMDGEKCVAQLPYCRLCIRRGAKEVIWTLNNLTGTSMQFEFGPKGGPNQGIKLQNPTRKKPISGVNRKHFKGPDRLTFDTFRWLPDVHPTFGPVTLQNHGHEAHVKVKGTDKWCEFRDPVILNTEN